jgi:hypothetical protein
MKANTFLPTLVAAFTLALPSTGLSDRNKVTVYRDRDGDGHYNKKTYSSHHHHGHGYYGGGYNRGYYGRSYYNGYRYPRYYGGSYGYYGRPYYGPSIGLSFYSRPTYYSSRVYRGAVVNDSLAADVQRALKRRGYYHGSIDGDIGPGSRSAIRAYQRDKGLSITGRIDNALLRSLRVS